MMPLTEEQEYSRNSFLDRCRARFRNCANSINVHSILIGVLFVLFFVIFIMVTTTGHTHAPHQPVYFEARTSSNSWPLATREKKFQPWNDQNILHFDTVLVNVGVGMYENGSFIAPVAGIYSFDIWGLLFATSNNASNSDLLSNLEIMFLFESLPFSQSHGKKIQKQESIAIVPPNGKDFSHRYNCQVVGTTFEHMSAGDSIAVKINGTFEKGFLRFKGMLISD